jgi:hypothetical protein
VGRRIVELLQVGEMAVNKAVLVSGHTCSAGWSSGGYGGRLSKGDQPRLKQAGADDRGEMEDRAAVRPGGGMDEADEPAPGTALLHDGHAVRLLRRESLYE